MASIRTSDGLDLQVDDQGSGPTVVMISGLGGQATFWAGIAEGLTEHFRVITFDQRGTGRSDRPDGPYSLERIATDTIDLLNALAIDDACFVGHSTGGVIAQLLATKARDRVRAAVLSASWSRPDGRFRTLFETRAAVLDCAGAAAYSQLTALLGHSPAWLEANRATVELAARRAPEEMAPLSVARARIQMLLDFPGVEGVGTIAAPVLVCGALDDWIVPFAHSEQLAEEIPDAHLSIWEGGHFFPRAVPDAFSCELRGFLRRVCR
jgi:aminoacrylate hydrolase